MKKHVLLATGLAVLSTGAYASKARMEALGQNTAKGSFYIDDTRNIFKNAAELNNTKNYVVTEWGDTNASEAVEGGFFREAGNFAYGLYFGDEVNGVQSRTNSNFLAADNNLDLFIAGDMGVKWGAKLRYSSNEDHDTANSVDRESNGLGLSFGAEMGAIKAYVNGDLTDESKGTATAGGAADKFEGSGWNFGAAYKMNNTTFFADYVTKSKEETVASTKTETDTTTLTLGAGHIHEVSSTARVFTDVAYVMEEEEIKGGNKTETSTLPLTIGFEADATSWLVVRGSIAQNVLINSKEVNGKKSNVSSTDVAAGATLNFGKLKVDGVIGSDNGTEKGSLRLDEVMSKVAVSYWF